MSKETFELVDEAVRGDKAALESLINNIQDFVYNLALRMLGTPLRCGGRDAGNYH